MKTVSFKVAKAIKEAGYPQDRSSNCYNTHTGEFHYTSCSDNWLNIGDYIDAPNYLDVWLWLWRDKGIHLNTNTQRKGIVCIYWDETIFHEIKDMRINDPEEAIIAAIEYLVNDDLIK